MFLKRRGAIPAQADVDWSPGGHVLVDDMVNDFKPLDINPLTPGADVEQTYQLYAERADGVSDPGLGMVPRGGNIKATTVNVAATQGSIRLSDIVRRCQNAIIEIGKQVLGLCYQFMPDEELAYFGVPRSDLVLPWDLEGHGNTTTANKMQRREESLALYNTLGMNPYVNHDLHRGWRITRDLLLAFDRTDVANYIGTESEIDAMLRDRNIEAEKASAVQQALQGSGAPPQLIQAVMGILSRSTPRDGAPQGGNTQVPGQMQHAAPMPTMSPPGGIEEATEL